MLIDARPYKPKYIKGHIPMAVSIPDSQFDKMTDRLPADKNSLLIFYCGGLKCKLSHKSAMKAEKLGYTNVKVFAEGYPAWMADKAHYPSVSAEWVKGQIDKGTDMDAGGLPSQTPRNMTRPISPRPSAFPTCSSTNSRTSCPRTKANWWCSTAAACTAS
jgi:rhodanese-related sulfurtransferase